jgi:hypothetical protein
VHGDFLQRCISLYLVQFTERDTAAAARALVLAPNIVQSCGLETQTGAWQ